MLDFTLESPRRFLNEIVTVAEPGKTERAVADRRAAVAGPPSRSNPLRKRRRYDSMNSTKPAPIEW
jgi:hypothetical protein